MTIQDISNETGLGLITTTSEGSGYPKNLKDALIGLDDFEQAQEIADKYNLEIQIFTKKDGWHLYHRTGNTAHEPLKNSSDNFGDDYSEFAPESEEQFVKETTQHIGDNLFLELDEVKLYLQERSELYRKYEGVSDGEIIITYRGDFYDQIPRQSMSFYHDTKTTIIGLIQKD